MINRKLFAFFCLILLSLLAGCASITVSSPKPIESGEEVNIFVTTDIHYLAEDLNDRGKAFQKYFSSGDGRQLNYITEIVDAFAADVERKRPDILIVSGDLTNNGEKKSHIRLAEKLKDIEKTAGTRVFVIPGNHDINNPWARGFKGEDQYVADSIDPGEFEKIYKNFGYGEAISRDESTLSYLAAPSKDLWLLMLDTCVYDTNYKYGSPATYGEINEGTYQWIKECSKLAEENNARILTVMHHNLMNHSMTLHAGFTLDNNDKAIKTFRECGINLVLSGHIHIQDIKATRGEETPIYDIATSSLGDYPVQYGTLTYSPAEGFDYATDRVDVEGWAKATETQDENLQNFKVYNKDFFTGLSYEKNYGRLTKTGLYSEEESKLIAETVSRLNANYFAGAVSSVREDITASPSYKLLLNTAEPESMISYVRSMIYDYGMENNRLHISN